MSVVTSEDEHDEIVAWGTKAEHDKIFINCHDTHYYPIEDITA